MLIKKLFKDDIEPRCAYCEFGKISGDRKSILCRRRGIMTGDYSCRSFVYDPLKRVPKKSPEMQKFDPSEFEL